MNRASPVDLPTGQHTMNDPECVAFLQWLLPRLRMRWAGFRRVRRQVCKRIQRRIRELGLAAIADYQTYVEEHDGEWALLDSYCRISISRFYRDRGVFDRMCDQVLPGLRALAEARGDREVRAWCAGCASGEEAYTLLMAWKLGLDCGGMPLAIAGTDADPELLERASSGTYPASSVKHLPPAWLSTAFTEAPARYLLLETFRRGIRFERQDIRNQLPEGTFHLVLCRNLIFTYFEEALQRDILERMLVRLLPGGVLVIGKKERLPKGDHGLEAVSAALGIYRKRE